MSNIHYYIYMSTYVIGVDPGKKGGIAVICGDGTVVDVVTMPETPQDLLEFLRDVTAYDGSCVCYLEKVGGMPGNGGAAMFNFGKGYGWIEMALLALEIPTVSVTPQKWQKMYGVGSSSITKSSSAEKNEHKRKLKAAAQGLFPSVGRKITLCTCDSLLIANYGRMTERGK